MRTWRTYGTSGSLTTASKLISAIPSRACLSSSFFETLPQTFRPRFRRWISRSPLHFGEFVRIYEMLELEVTYSRIRIVSTSSGAALEEKKNERKGETSSALTILSSWESCITPVHVYTVPLINFHDAHYPARNFPCRSLFLSFFFLTSHLPLLVLFAVLSMHFHSVAIEFLQCV